MANMGYCRFRNTLKDLYDCRDHIDDYDMPYEEQQAKANLIKLCQQIAEMSEDDES